MVRSVEAVLGLARVSMSDDFFALGGHSLLLTQLALRIEELLGARLPLRAAFADGRVQALADLVKASAVSSLPNVPKLELISTTPGAATAGPFPLSSEQQRLWTADLVLGRSNSAVYNITTAFVVPIALDPARLSQALAALAQRHTILRTVFSAAGQTIQSQGPALVVLGPEEDFHNKLGDEIHRSFDLSNGPCWTLYLAPPASPGSGCTLLLNIHHIIFDGLSLPVLLSDLGGLYAGETLEPLPCQYVDYAAWQQRLLQGEQSLEDLRYWTQQLSGRQLALPYDKPHRATPTHRAGSRSRRLGPELFERLQALARQARVTTYAVLLSALTFFLGSYSHSSDVSVGCPLGSRPRPELNRLIGYFGNTVAFRNQLVPGESFLELLRRVHSTIGQGVAHSHLPYEALASELRAAGDFAPLFQAVLAYQPTDALRFGSQQPVTVLPEFSPSLYAKFDLLFEAEEIEADLKLSLVFSTDLFESETAVRMLDYLAHFLADVARRPADSLDSLTFSPPETAALILGERPPPPVLPSTTLQGLFAKQAAEQLDAVALTEQGESWTYGQLDRLTNRVAAELQSLGVTANDFVALALAPSAHMIIGLLGILKAGAAYIPLDPVSIASLLFLC